MAHHHFIIYLMEKHRVKLNKKPKVSVIGLGFVGLSIALANAKKGFVTIGVDIDDNKIESIRNQKINE